MTFVKTRIYLFTTLLLCACTEERTKTITINNTLEVERSFETVELTSALLQLGHLDNVGIRDMENGEWQVTQLIDDNGDGTNDLLLFQPRVPAASKKKYELVLVSGEERPEAPESCYSRFVPERTDDYAWENDKVAFRVYGPAAQKMVEEGRQGGTLSSGVDAWLKKVAYPIIDRWYQKETETDGTYHEDTGEGLDNFHVGVSRGVGGIALKQDSTYYFSKNYTQWRTLSTGPIRTSFYLEYAPWGSEEKQIGESRVISLDLGSNFSRFELNLKGTEEIAAGLTLHEKDGEMSVNKDKGWLSYWQPHGDSELGMAIIVPPKSFLGYERYDSEENDKSNAYAHLKLADGRVVYFAGFGWKESGQFRTKQEWEDHLDLFAEKIGHPLEVTLQ